MPDSKQQVVHILIGQLSDEIYIIYRDLIDTMINTYKKDKS